MEYENLISSEIFRLYSEYEEYVGSGLDLEALYRALQSISKIFSLLLLGKSSMNIFRALAEAKRLKKQDNLYLDDFELLIQKYNVLEGTNFLSSAYNKVNFFS